MKITFYRGGLTPKSSRLPSSSVCGPGYSYRFALSDLPEFPNQMFYPTLEVRGSLILSDRLRTSGLPRDLGLRK